MGKFLWDLAHVEDEIFQRTLALPSARLPASVAEIELNRRWQLVQCNGTGKSRASFSLSQPELIFPALRSIYNWVTRLTHIPQFPGHCQH